MDNTDIVHKVWGEIALSGKGPLRRPDSSKGLLWPISSVSEQWNCLRSPHFPQNGPKWAKNRCLSGTNGSRTIALGLCPEISIAHGAVRVVGRFRTPRDPRLATKKALPISAPIWALHSSQSAVADPVQWEP